MIMRLENIQVGKGQYLYKTGRCICGTKSMKPINRSGMLGHVHRLVKGEQSEKVLHAVPGLSKPGVRVGSDSEFGQTWLQ